MFIIVTHQKVNSSNLTSDLSIEILSSGSLRLLIETQISNYFVIPSSTKGTSLPAMSYSITSAQGDRKKTSNHCK